LLIPSTTCWKLAIAPRAAIVEDLERRLNALTDLSADVDRRLAASSRRARPRKPHRALQGVAPARGRAAELAALNAAQDRLEPTVAQIAGLKSDRRGAHITAGSSPRRRDAGSAGAAACRPGRDHASSATSRSARKPSRAARELGKAGALKEELLRDLAQVQSRERETFAQFEAAEDRCA
jgi:hypothetical protein